MSTSVNYNNLISKSLIFLIVFLSPITIWGMGSQETVQICKLVRHNIDHIDDGDGLEIADFNNDGKMDIVIAESEAGKIVWYEQGDSLDTWKRHEIISGYTKIEGVDVLSTNETNYIIILEQAEGKVIIAGDENGEPEKEWKQTTLDSDAPWVQCSLEADIDQDGDFDIFYAYEGKNQHEGGGIYWLENLGGDLLNAENWKKNLISRNSGAWWIAQNRIDANGDGNITELIFTSRDAQDGGIFWLEPTENITDPWIKHTIEDGEDYRPLHVTTGNFFDDDNNYDIAAAAMNEGEGAYLYRFSDGFSRHILRKDGQFHNIIALNLDNKGRDELILVRGKALLSVFLDNIMVYQFDQKEYVQRWKTIYRKADDRIIAYDLTKNGYAEVISVAANDNSVDWWEVKFGVCPSPFIRDLTILSIFGGLIAILIILIRKIDFKKILNRIKSE